MKTIFILLGLFLFFVPEAWCTSLEITDRSDIKIASHRNLVEFPDRNELQKRIEKIMITPKFDKAMKLSYSLVSSPKEPLWIIMAVNFAFDYYCEELQPRLFIPKIPDLKFKLMREILRDHPTVIQELEETGMLNGCEDKIENKTISRIKP